jgi:hypothetical protein
MDAHPNCVAVGTGVLLIDPEGDVLCSYPLLLTHQEIDNANLSLKGGSAIVHPSVMFRGDIVESIGGYRKSICTPKILTSFYDLLKLDNWRILRKIY